MEQTPASNNLIWLDLEMTGVNPDQDHILQLAIIITDYELNIVDDSFDVVIYQPLANLSIMSEFVKKLHTDNGLLSLVEHSKIDLKNAENLALNFIKKYVTSNSSPMCGNSICLDRRFLFKYMPSLENYFHYRNLDVSSIKLLANYWFPEKVKDFQKAKSLHLAKEDVLNSIKELQFYRENLFYNR